MATRCKNVRLDDVMLALIRRRMIAENCDESAAIKSLIQDGAGAPRPRPVVAQIACRKDLDDLLRVITEWRRDFSAVKNRLACYTASSSDLARNAKIEKWTKIADDLEAKLDDLGAKLDALVQIMTGLSNEDWAKLEEAKELLRNFMAGNQAALANPQINAAEKKSCVSKVSKYQAALRAFDLFEA